MKSEAESFADRLRAALAATHTSDKPVELMKLVPRHGGTAVSQQAISNWLSGKNKPRLRNIRALAKLLRIDPLRLELGDEEARKVREPHAVWNTKGSAIDHHAVDDYFALPEPQRKLGARIDRRALARQQEDEARALKWAWETLATARVDTPLSVRARSCPIPFAAADAAMLRS